MSQAATAGAAPRVTEAPVRSRRINRALLRPILMLGGILLVAVASGAYWLSGGRYVSIDDAYVRAAKETLSTDVSGIVQDLRDEVIHSLVAKAIPSHSYREQWDLAGLDERAKELLALDLPLKVLVWQDGDGRVWFSYNATSYLQTRHGAPADLMKALDGVVALVQAAAAD